MGDDLRQDILVLQIIRLFDNFWKEEGKDLHVSPYCVIATGSRSGMVEIVPKSKTTAEIQKVFNFFFSFFIFFFFFFFFFSFFIFFHFVGMWWRSFRSFERRCFMELFEKRMWEGNGRKLCSLSLFLLFSSLSYVFSYLFNRKDTFLPCHVLLIVSFPMFWGWVIDITIIFLSIKKDIFFILTLASFWEII